MKKSKFKLNRVAAAVMLAMAAPVPIDMAYAGAGWGNSVNAAGAPIKVPTYYANSPSGIRPDVSPAALAGATVNTGVPLRKFVDGLPGLTNLAANALGQYLPVAVADKTTYPGSDYYEIGIVEYAEKMHSDLPKATTLRGYVQLETPANAATSKHIPLTYPNGTPILNAANQPVFAVDNPHYLGPVISASRGVPVRIKYSNLLPIGQYDPITKSRGGDLFLPVDKTLAGAGPGPVAATNYTQNRAEIHLHGGDTPWISDGTPHQWITPSGEVTPFPKGASFQNVPDMPDPGPGSGTLYYPNNQSARLMFYHDHTDGITRVNVYGGMAAGYLISDPVEQGMVTRGILPLDQIPLIIQDKTFVPLDIAQQDAFWDTAAWGQPGDLWFPHVYEPNQSPTALGGLNPAGRWDYGPWFWPVFPAPLPLPTGVYGNASTTPEAFMDTPVVNGTAYPTVTVQPKAYRLRILNAANDRFVNLGLYVAADKKTIMPVAPATTATPVMCDGISPVLATDCTEVKTIPASTVLPLCSTVVPAPAKSPATDLPVGAGTTCWPDLWPADARAGGVPDPLTAGPKMVQIGSEGGFLPKPHVISPTPIGFKPLRAGISTHGLYMAPAERSDVIVDFSQYAGKTLILYNDSPAPVPGNDPRYDYYTGDPDQSGIGGAFSTLPGFGPNTRTIMQIVVANVAPAAPFDASPAGPLATELLKAYTASQPNPIAAETAYNGTAAPVVLADTYAGIEVGSSLTPTFNFTTGDALSYKPYDPVTKTVLTTLKTVAAGTAVTDFPVQNKAIMEQFDSNYGRLNATLGVGLPFASSLTRTALALGYIDPATETISDGETQIWKITHNGLDTHPVHFHLVNVQVINRVGWDGVVKPPEPNEVGWKETVKMNPLEDIIVAVRSKGPLMPFGIPDSLRAQDPTQALGVTAGFTQVDPVTGALKVVSNTTANFGWEYVWHCHILGHEENDFMRPIIFKYTAMLPAAPTTLAGGTAVAPATGVTLTWTDPTPAGVATTLGNAQNETGFSIERATGTAPFAAIGKALANATTFTDTTAIPTTAYSYRVVATNAAGNSLPSNTVLVQAATQIALQAATLAATNAATQATAAQTAATQAAAQATAAQAAAAQPAGPAAAQAANLAATQAATFAAAALTASQAAATQAAAAQTAAAQAAADTTVAGPQAAAQATAAQASALAAATAATQAAASQATAQAAATQATQAATLAAIQAASLAATNAATQAAAAQTDATQAAAQAALAQAATTPPVTPAAVLAANQAAAQATTLAAAALTALQAAAAQVTAAQAAAALVAADPVAAAQVAAQVTAAQASALAAATASTQAAAAQATAQAAATTAAQSVPSSALTPNLPHSFLPQALGTTSAAQPEVLNNTAKVALPINSIKIGGIDAGHFAQTNNCGASLAAGTSCTINVVSKPTTAGNKSATLIVDDAAGIKSVALSGSGTGSLASKLSLASVSYLAQQVGTTSAVRTVKLANTGTSPLPVTSVVISGANAADFAQTNTCATPVAKGGGCAVNVTFAPSTIGLKTATLTVVDGAGTRTVALSGTGGMASSALAPNTSFDFGLQKVGKASVAKSVTLSNSGALPLTIKNIRIGGLSIADFSQKNNCGANLAVGASCKINLVFKPSALGANNADLIVDDAAGTKSIALSGKGQ